MPQKGQILSNPINGDTHEFLETAKDTAGERVVLKAVIRSKGKLVPDHFHLLQEETFEVASGRLTVWSEGRTSVITAGEKITLPKGKPHNHYNNDDAPVTYIHTMVPALDFDYLIENLVGLAGSGKSKNGKYGFLQELVTLKYIDSKSFLAGIPLGLQKVLMNIFGPMGRQLGYRAVYKKYSDIEK